MPLARESSLVIPSVADSASFSDLLTRGQVRRLRADEKSDPAATENTEHAEHHVTRAGPTVVNFSAQRIVET